MELKITLISLLVIFSVIISETKAVRHRKIIIHVPVKVKKSQHFHTLIKPVHVHHKPTIIKEEKIYKTEIAKPVEYHKEIVKHYEHKAPEHKEDISHEHLHHHYKHVHPEVYDSSAEFNDHENSFQF